MALSPINRLNTALKTSRASRNYGIDALARLLQEYLPADQIAQVRAAAAFGKRQHQGQFRKSGEPYIYHPMAVARILAEMRLDRTTLIAAILHDVIEDTETAREELAAEFGEEVAYLVDGVSKLDKAQFISREQAQAENFRKLIMAMTKDVRVILVKLADRLHNMRTLGARAAEPRRRTARETLEIYAPIARRLGISTLCEELEDLGFAHLHPNRYDVLKRSAHSLNNDNRNLAQEIRETLMQALAKEGIEAEVVGRRKNLYSIYRKMRDKHLRFLDVSDFYGFRVIVDSVDTCYRALGIVHHCYRPITELFDDFIANPKLNGYQSLHTTLMAKGGIKFEVQIRSAEMHQIAESGVAAHWQYKLGEARPRSVSATDAEEWLNNLVELHNREGDPRAFFDNLRVDLLPHEVYVFTPRGDIMPLPRGATCVDLAYAVHTDLGNHCVAARVDGHLAPLNSQLRSGQVVDIITARHARPNAAWLHFLRTGKARAGVRRYLKNQRSDKAERLGRRLLDKALREMGSSLRKLKSDDLQQGLAQMQFDDLTELCAEIGLGRRLAPLAARHFLPDGKADKGSRKKAAPLAVEGTEGLVLEFGKCCHPVPGDAIHGQVSVGRGLVVHRFGCKHSARRSHPADRVELTWSKRVSGDFPVDLHVRVRNERGVLASLTAKLADSGCDIENVSTPEHSGGITVIRMGVLVRDRRQLANIIRRLRRLPPVERVSRA